VDGLLDLALSGQWKFTIDKAIGLATPLAPTESLVVFRNQATPNDNKQVLPFNLATCSPSGSGLVGASSSLRIDSATSTTLLFSRNGSQWDDVMFLTPGPLWALFGGRRLTIDWVSTAK
jgi:hypothetical protein